MKQYTMAEIEVIHFDEEDVVVASCSGDCEVICAGARGKCYDICSGVAQ